ncbi:MAG: ABC transporter permease [Planctomycetaceae bacterium]|nr:ABC transporter permease [Planctomycetaceae bacterium]
MQAFIAIYLREMHLLRRRFKRVLAAMAVSPLLYLLTFGLALGGGMTVDGVDYLHFLLPGLAAMASMTQSFALASEINLARFYSGVCEEIQASPAGPLPYVLGETAAGVTRAVMAVVLILLLGLLFGVRIYPGGWFWLAILLNAAAFASLAVGLAMVIKSHADQALLGNFVITPMAFLGGTFFPMDALPEWLRTPLMLLPLSHASRAVRAAALGGVPDPVGLLILLAFAVACFAFAVYAVGLARD